MENHMMTLPRVEYDALIKQNKEMENLLYQMMDAFDERLAGIVMIRNENERYGSIHHRSQTTSSRVGRKRSIYERVEFVCSDQKWQEYFERQVLSLKEIQRYKDLADECLQLRRVLRQAYTALSQKGLLPTRKSRIEVALEVLGDVKVG